jgi:anti-sigma regulatory factor (Ser/Thr protein kinase)
VVVKELPMILKLSLNLPEEAPFVRLTRILGRSTLEYMRVIPAGVDEAETIIDELVANVVRHAHSKAGRFLLTLDYYARALVVTVKDTGTGFSLRDIAPAGTIRPDLDGGERTGGYGLCLVAAIADRLDFKRSGSKGTTVRAKMGLTYQTEGDAQRAQAMNGAQGMAAINGGSEPASPFEPRILLLN